MSEQGKREDPQFVVESRDDLAELLDRAGNWAERDVGADAIAAEFRQARDFVEDEPELVTDGGVDRSEAELEHGSEETKYDGVSLRQQARAERKFQRLRESDNPFAAVAGRLRDQGKSFEEIYRQYAAIEEALGDVAMAERSMLIPDWEVVVKEDADTPSGYRYDRYERTAETQAEAEDMVEKHTGLRAVSEQTKQVGYSRVL